MVCRGTSKDKDTCLVEKMGCKGCAHDYPDECLHCGKGKPGYCEECYQKLIAENIRLKLQIGLLEDKFKEEKC